MFHLSAATAIAPPPRLITTSLQEWAIAHCRSRTFFQDEIIPTRPGLLYFVTQGFVRLEGHLQQADTFPCETHPVTLMFLGADQPIDVGQSDVLAFQAIAQVNHTSVFWLYWQDLTQWPTFQVNVLQALRRQHQQQLLGETFLSQRKTIDRLWLYLRMLAQTHGTPSPNGQLIPFPLTSKQLSERLGATPVTINRLLKQLMQANRIHYVQAGLWEIAL
ncbi:Crp/Fnr family transcriptional regulator [Synechococcus moorigangaii CMS01]|nr:Crp/Fnr family transcriptional regulator [Synechococcus moorigangaii CMS01]